MNTIDLRNKLIQFITNADESYLRKIESLIYSNEDHEISDEQKKMLDERLARHKAHPNAGKPLQVVKDSLAKKYGI